MTGRNEMVRFGFKHSEVTRKKMSQSRKGKSTYWLKGKLFNHKEGCKCFRCSGVAWNKGKEYTQIRGQKHWLYGKHHNEETRKKISKNSSCHPAWNKGKKGIFSEESRKR